MYHVLQDTRFDHSSHCDWKQSLFPDPIGVVVSSPLVTPDLEQQENIQNHLSGSSN